MWGWGWGRILMVSSIVGAVSTSGGAPGTAVYSAAKAYGRVLGLSMAREMERYGVGVTCLMPGAVGDTNFSSASDTADALCWRIPFYPGRSRDAAGAGIRGLLAGDAEVYPGWQNRAFREIAVPILPRRIASLAIETAWGPIPRLLLPFGRRGTTTTTGRKRGGGGDGTRAAGADVDGGDRGGRTPPLPPSPSHPPHSTCVLTLPPLKTDVRRGSKTTTGAAGGDGGSRGETGTGTERTEAPSDDENDDGGEGEREREEEVTSESEATAPMTTTPETMAPRGADASEGGGGEERGTGEEDEEGKETGEPARRRRRP